MPGYLDAEVREKALRAAIRVDSLQQQLNYQEAYINNLKNVFTGVLDVDSVKITDTISVSENDPLLKRTEKEKVFVDRYEDKERYNLSVISPTASAALIYLICRMVVFKVHTLRSPFKPLALTP